MLHTSLYDGAHVTIRLVGSLFCNSGFGIEGEDRGLPKMSIRISPAGLAASAGRAPQNPRTQYKNATGIPPVAFPVTPTGLKPVTF